MAELLINYSDSPDPVSGAAQQRDYHTSEHCTLNTTTSNHRVFNLFIFTFLQRPLCVCVLQQTGHWSAVECGMKYSDRGAQWLLGVSPSINCFNFTLQGVPIYCERNLTHCPQIYPRRGFLKIILDCVNTASMPTFGNTGCRFCRYLQL